MNILYLVPALESGGVERGTIDLAVCFKKMLHTVIVVSNGGSLVSELEKYNILHVKLPVNKKNPSVLMFIPKLCGIIRTHKIDIVHASSRIPAWIGFFASKLTGTSFVTSCHGYYSKHIFSRVMGYGELVMAISHSVAERMRETFGVPEGKIRIVPRGVDLDKYTFYPDKYNYPKDRFVVLNIGRLTPIKGHCEFIKAINAILKSGKDIEGWIAGRIETGKGDYFAELKKLISKLDIAAHIRFFNDRDDIPSLLKKADVLVLSSNIPEGFGRTVIEAGAVGTAVCASDIGGIKEIIEDGIDGLLFPPGDEHKMAESILNFLDDFQLCKRCTLNMRKKVEKFYTLTHMAELTLSVYEEVLKKR